MWKAGDPSCQLKIEEHPGYLYALIGGKQDSFEITLHAVTELAAVCRARGATRLLVEHDVPSRLSKSEVYTIATQLPALYRGIVVAFVIRQSLVPDNPAFLETVARNRGGNGRLFASIDDAVKWLTLP